MTIPIYEIDYNKQTGYYNIIDSDGNRYGEYLTFDEADEALQSNTFDEFDTTVEVDDKEVEEEYVVCREYISHRQHYVMFTRGKLSDHVSYPQSSVTYRSGFNDTSIKIYNSMQEAKHVANLYNKISRDKGYYKMANWKAMMKWW